MDVTLVVDALSPRLNGIARYTWELCKRVPAQPGVGRVGFLANGRFIEDPGALLDGTPRRRRRRFRRWLDRQFAERRIRRTLVHGPNYFLPPNAESGIVTVHDLSVFRFSGMHPAERLKAFEHHFESSLRRASHVITDSETVRQEVIADFCVSARKVSAIPLGVNRQYRPHSSEELRARLAPLGLKPSGYGLCVSTLEPRKKIAELIRAWGELPGALRRETPLVLAGGEGWLNEPLHDEIERAMAAGWLRHLGYVSEADLPALYAGAALFIYPSVYEGFGLPPIEAMASGVPVVVSNRSCLPEVCGDAARFVDPDDNHGMVTGIQESLADSTWRSAAIRRGLERSAQFTWERCIEETVTVYKNAWAS